MANPYSTQTISGYNANPPSDDATQVASNQIEWQKHLDKIGGPIKTLSEAINTELLSAFGKIAFNSVNAKTANYTALASDQGKLITAANAITITLPAASVGPNFFLAVKNINTDTDVVTIDGAGSETIDNNTTLALGPQDFILLVSSGTAWTSGHVRASPQVEASNTFHVNDINGTPNIDGSGFSNVNSSVAESTWESFGPTGSGADNIWDDLNAVPNDADWVEIRFILRGLSLLDAADTQRRINIYARKNGSLIGAGNSTLVARGGAHTSSAGNALIDLVTQHKIPVDSSIIFELFWFSEFNLSANIDIFLTGYGQNGV